LLISDVVVIIVRPLLTSNIITQHFLALT